MAEYLVEMRGEARELFVVEADSAEQARERWMDGVSVLTELSSMEVYDVQEES